MTLVNSINHNSMASSIRGKYSKKEFETMKKPVEAGAVVSKYAEPTSMQSAANAVTQAQKVASQSKYDATMIPQQILSEFKAKGDPKLEKSINKKQQEVFGGYTEGMSKYADIKDPFQRRILADKYQSGLSNEHSALVSEKERRQGQLNDYISKWSTTFGAQAALAQDAVTQAQTSFSMQKDIADSKSKASSALEKDYTDREIISTISQLKKDGKDWESIAGYLADKGVDVLKGSFADNQLRRAHGLDPVKAIETGRNETEKQVYDREKYSEINKVIEKAKNNQDGYYMDGNKVMKKKFFGDEKVYTIK